MAPSNSPVYYDAFGVFEFADMCFDDEVAKYQECRLKVQIGDLPPGTEIAEINLDYMMVTIGNVKGIILDFEHNNKVYSFSLKSEPVDVSITPAAWAQ